MIYKPNSFLEVAASELEKGKRVKVLIGGGSMLPFIIGGQDVVEIEPCENLVIGDIVLFIFKGHFMLHRLVSVNHGSFLFKGDANTKKCEEVTADCIIGKVCAINRKGKVPLARRLRALAKKKYFMKDFTLMESWAHSSSSCTPLWQQYWE